MAVLIPNPEIAARWNGALQARLRREPLDHFLRFQGLPVTAAGPACVTDNLARAALYLVDAGLRAGLKTQAVESPEMFRSTLARTICAVTDGLATLIDEGASWRSAALVAASQLLSRFVSTRAAAGAAAAAAHAYDASFKDLSPDVELQDISHRAASAVRTNDLGELKNTVRLISLHLEPRRRVAPANPAYAALLPFDLAGGKVSP
jgi:hypothetical protein